MAMANLMAYFNDVRFQSAIFWGAFYYYHNFVAPHSSLKSKDDIKLGLEGCWYGLEAMLPGGSEAVP